MAIIRIKDLGPPSGSLRPTDSLAVDLAATDGTRKVTLQTLMAGFGVGSYTVAGVPGGYVGGLIYVTNGLKAGETSGSGTGVLCQWDGTNWVAVDTGSAVAA